MKTVCTKKKATVSLLTDITLFLLLLSPMTAADTFTSHFIQSSPFVTIYFEQGIFEATFFGEATTGFMISRKHILAPADPFLSPNIRMTVPRIKSSATPAPDGFYCSDRKVKAISHLEFQPEINDEIANDSPLTDTDFDTIRINNKQNSDGSHRVDAQICYKVSSSSIYPTGSVAVLTLGENASQQLSEKIRSIGTVKLDKGDPSPQETTHFLFRDCRYCSKKSIKIKQDEIVDLKEKLREIGAIYHNIQNAPQTPLPKTTDKPAAILTVHNEILHLQSLISNWQLVEDFPDIKSLPTYHQRHPQTSKLWTITSPVTGTLWHALKNLDFIGAEHEAPVGSIVTFYLLPVSYLGSLLGYLLITGKFLNERVFFKNYMSAAGVLSVALLIKGFHDWWLSDY